jgi:hypothetical protein
VHPVLQVDEVTDQHRAAGVLGVVDVGQPAPRRIAVEAVVAVAEAERDPLSAR